MYSWKFGLLHFGTLAALSSASIYALIQGAEILAGLFVLSVYACGAGFDAVDKQLSKTSS